MNLRSRLSRTIALVLTLAISFSLVPWTLPVAAAGSSYYVAKNGSDANPGTTGSPFLTIQRAADIAAPGDHVYIKSGTYSGSVTLSKQGTASQQITFEAFQNDTVVLGGRMVVNGDYNAVDGLEFVTGPGTVAWPNKELSVYGNHNTFDNLYFHDYTGQLYNGGILIGRPSTIDASYNTFRNTRLIRSGSIYISSGNSAENTFLGGEVAHSQGMLVRFGGLNNTVDGFELHDPGRVGSGGNDADGINVHGSGHVIRNSRLYNVFRQFANQHSDALQWWTTADDLLIENNVIGSAATGGIYNEGDYGHIMYSGTTNRVTIRNNVFLGTGGYYLFNVNIPATVSADDWVLTNNVFKAAAGIRDFPTGNNWKITNNIFYSNGREYANGATYQIDNNLYVGGATKSSWDGPGSQEVADVAFINDDMSAATNYGIDADWRLQPGSPAIDVGTSVGAPAADAAGDPRYDDPATPNGGTGTYTYYDIGAFEYQGEGNEPPPDTTPPIISGVLSTDVALTSAGVSWTTDEAADSQIDYGTSTNYGSSTAIDGAYTTDHTQSLTGLATSTTYHYQVKSRDAAGNLAVSADRTFATLAPPAPGGYEYIAFEGEDAALTSPMTTGADGLASDGAYVYATGGDGTADYTFSIAGADNYVVWARVIAPDSGHDSFFGSMDASADDVWDVLLGTPSSTWQWEQMRLRGAGTFDAPEFDPKQFYLGAGTHTLQIKAREMNTLVDRLVITNDPDYVPDPGSSEPPDTTAPTTAFGTTPAAPNGANGWFATAPTIALTRDEPGITYYQWDSTAGAWQTHVGDMSAREGAHTLYYYSVDTVGNTEAPAKSVNLKVDTQAPAGTAITPLSTFQTGASFPVAWSGSDGSGSGIASYDIQYRYENGSWQNGLQGVDRTSSTFNSPSGDGAYDFRARATDKAGNVESYSAAPSATTIVDTQAPTDPTLTSVTHNVGESSEEHVIEASWTGAADNGSGVDGYSIDWSSAGTSLPDKTKDLEQGANGAVSPELADGTWYFNLRTVDNAGNWTSTVHMGPLEIVTPQSEPPAGPADTNPPTGTVEIEGGAAYTTSTEVNLNLSADDGTGSGVTQMRLSNDGVFDDTAGLEGWRSYADTADWTLVGDDGQKVVHAQFKDADGNESAVYSDTIGLDRTDPKVTLAAPSYSTVQSKTTTFKINWGGTDPSPASGIDSYTVRYRPANSRTWTDWKIGTTQTSAEFTGSAGRTYYFRVKAYDKAGNIGWSMVKRTIVPYNEGSLIYKRRGFVGSFTNPDSSFYLDSVKYSMKKSERISYKFDGDHIALISTLANSRGKAKIYIDGNYKKTIDTYSPGTQHHKVVFSQSFDKAGIHYIKIVNLGTPGHSRFDIDGLAVGR